MYHCLVTNLLFINKIGDKLLRKLTTKLSTFNILACYEHQLGQAREERALAAVGDSFLFNIASEIVTMLSKSSNIGNHITHSRQL